MYKLFIVIIFSFIIATKLVNAEIKIVDTRGLIRAFSKNYSNVTVKVEIAKISSSKEIALESIGEVNKIIKPITNKNIVKFKDVSSGTWGINLPSEMIKSIEILNSKSTD
jgi:hypothetical protein